MTPDESTVIQNGAWQRNGYSSLCAVESPPERNNSLSNNAVRGDPIADILTSTEKVADDIDTFHFCREMKLLSRIALPTAATQFSSFFVFPQTASIIGTRLPSGYLAAFSLGSLSGNLTCTSVIIGTLSAAETLQPRAFGLREYREVGLLSVRGVAVCAAVLVPFVILLLLGAESVFAALLPDDGGPAERAGAWLRVYVWTVPPLVLFRVVQRYLACQNVVVPVLCAAAFGCFVFHPLFLRWAVGRFGFLGSAAAVAATQYVQTLGAFACVHALGHHEPLTWPCWPGSGSSRAFLREALRWEGLRNYARLGLGGILSLTEWWFWETICFTAGRIGMVELCAHTVAYQVIPITFMVVLGMSIGLSVRMGALLPVSVSRAKRLAACTMGVTIVIAVLISSLVFIFREEIISTFTSDPDVVEQCHLIWRNLCIHNIVMFVFGVNSGILRALGLQWRMAATIISVLWCAGLPIIIYFCLGARDGGLVEMWRILPRLYMVLNVCLSLVYLTADWQHIGDSIVVPSKR